MVDRKCRMGIKLDPACRHLVPCAAAAAAKKAAPNIDHPGIVFRGQAIRRGGPMPLFLDSKALLVPASQCDLYVGGV